MGKRFLTKATTLLAGATLTALIAVPVAGSAANLSGSSFAVKAVNKEEAAKHFAIRPFFDGKDSTPEPTAPPVTTAPPTTPAPSPSPTGPTLDPSYPSPTPEASFTWSLNADGTANLMGYKGTPRDIVIPQTATISGVARVVTSIERQGLRDRGLTSVVMPDTVKSIGDFAFYNNRITSLKLSSSLTFLDDYAFSTNMLSSVVIPDKLTKIPRYAFNNNQLTSVTLGSSVTAIEGQAFSQNALTAIDLPQSLTSLGYNAFAFNSLSSVTIPDRVTAIDDGAFRNNTSITSVKLSSSLQSIGPNAFLNASLSELRIPASVTSIGNAAFPGAKKIYMEGNAPTTISAAGTSGGFGSAGTAKIIYYKTTATGYTSPTWKGYASATY